jgi:phosphoglycolate phosphatase-like HAD superfamily hydrolase
MKLMERGEERMIKTVLFDVDGVLLSEEHYFDASALTVWELLMSNNYLGLAPSKFKTNYQEDEIKEIREEVFEKDTVLKLLKSRGLNANWDMIYLTFSYQLISLLSQLKDTEKIKNWLSKNIDRDTLREIGEALRNTDVTTRFDTFIEDFQKSTQTKQGLMGQLDVIAQEMLGFETSIFKEKGSLWSICEHVSQEWYVGDENVLESTGRPSVQLGKKGFLSEETTLAPSDEIAKLFSKLTNAGLSIGIGTGRPELETIQPFHHLDWLKYFDKNHIITADDVLRAEKAFPKLESLSKPHPFTYILALSGRNSDNSTIINAELPIVNAKEVLIVGDSLADLLAARVIGCQFAAVLTGLSGKKARSDFEKHDADYILDNVLDLTELIRVQSGVNK